MAEYDQCISNKMTCHPNLLLERRTVPLMSGPAGRVFAGTLVGWRTMAPTGVARWHDATEGQWLPTATDHQNEVDGGDLDIILMSHRHWHRGDHTKALDKVIPALQAKGVARMGATPLKTGFLYGHERFNSRDTFPEGMVDKRRKMQQIAQAHNVNLGVAGLQFVNANLAYCGQVPGANHPDQVRQNVAAFSVQIPADSWAELKQQKLIDERAPIPA